MTNHEAVRLDQFQRLNAGLARLAAGNRFYLEKFARAGVKLGPLASWDEFHRLPFTTKAELLADQVARPPYGTNLTAPLDRYVRMHQTSGTHGTPLRWLDTAENWDWVLGCWDAIFEAAEVTLADRLLFPFSFGPFLGFWAAFDNSTRRGRFAVAAGGLSSAARLELIAVHECTVVLCTPSYALRLGDIAEETGFDLAGCSVKKLILAGEPGANIPATRARIEAQWRARVFDHSGMTEIGSLGLEYIDFPGNLCLLEDRCIAECVDISTLAPVPVGELGELVLTNLGRWDSPLIRYRTGDIVRLERGEHPPGRPLARLTGGILGRVDEMFWIRGNNVYPSAVEQVVRGIEGIREFAMELVERPGEVELHLQIEPAPAAAASAAQIQSAVAKAIQDRLHFRPSVETVAPGMLPIFEMKSRRLNIRRPSP